MPRGDFITAIQLIVSILSALQETGSASAESNSLYQELQQLKLVLDQLRGLPNDASLSQSHLNAVRGMALTVKRPLQEFVTKIEMYKRLCRVMAAGTEEGGKRGGRRD